MKRTPNPLESAIAEVKQALDAKLYHLALVMVLTFPGICAALEDDRGYSDRDEYKKWYTENLSTLFPFMNADECYSLRCGFVHKAEFDIKSKGSDISRVLFTIKGTSPISGHNNKIGDALHFDVIDFCNDVLNAVNIWYNDNSTKKNVIMNANGIVRYRPNGMRPYFSGVPVIA